MAISRLLSVWASLNFTERLLNVFNSEPNGGRAFPYQNIYTTNNTVEACLNQCAAFGYPAAGMEVHCYFCLYLSLALTHAIISIVTSVVSFPHLSPRSTQAHDGYTGCGDISDITTSGATFAPETDCNLPCSGDPIHLCGGPLRLSVYYWNSTTNPLYVWNTPANTGYYEVSSFDTSSALPMYNTNELPYI